MGDNPPVSAKLDLVRSIYADWERGDFSRSDWADSEIEYVWADGPSPDSWRGLQGMAAGFRELLNAWEDYRVEAEECRALPDGRVLVIFQHYGRGRTSGLELGPTRDTPRGVGKRGAMVFEVHAECVTRIETYTDSDRAPADLGLTPDTGT